MSLTFVGNDEEGRPIMIGKPESEPPVRSSELVSLREKAEASLHHWQRTREDSSRLDHRQNCDFQICWLRGYVRALDDILGKQANNRIS